MFGRLTLVCMFMNFLLVTAIEKPSIIVDFVAIFTIGVVGMALLESGRKKLLKTKR